MKVVFIVDDVETNLLLAKQALEGSYRTLALPSAADMFKLIERIKPDLILLDVDMPEMDGFEAIQILKKDENLKSIPIIFLTGKKDTASEIRGFELGALDFIYKPFTAPVLLKRIESHIKLDELMKTIISKNEQLLRIQEAKDNILGMISHDLKNYLAITISGCEMLTMFNEDLNNNKYMNMITDASNKAVALLKDILTMNKIDINDHNLTLSELDITKEIISALERLNLLAKQKNVEILTDFTDQNLFCMINPEKFNRVIDNLIINAIKFTNDGGRIIVKTNIVNRYAQIHIIDNGIGMDNVIISKLFQQYSQVGRVGTAGESSTGLGLYIVKQIIEQHNGKIDVLSSVGTGSEFIIKLPILFKNVVL